MGVYQTAVLSKETILHYSRLILECKLIFVVLKVIHTNTVCILSSFPDFPTL